MLIWVVTVHTLYNQEYLVILSKRYSLDSLLADKPKVILLNDSIHIICRIWEIDISQRNHSAHYNDAGSINIKQKSFIIESNCKRLL